SDIMSPSEPASVSMAELSLPFEDILETPVAALPPPPIVPEAPKDDFEIVLDTIMEDLGETELPVSAAVSAAATSPPPESIDSLSDLCQQAQPQTPEAFLMLAAYYLTYFEAE